MMNHNRIVVFLCTPLTPQRDEMYLSERAHIQTLGLLSARFRDVAVVARCRNEPVLAPTEHVALNSTGARLAYELPDFGSGSNGFGRSLRLLFSRRHLRALSALVQPADMVYVEVPSVEGFLVWRLARKLGKPYVIEMRGETLINSNYMRLRFGWRGLAASRVLALAFGVVRRGAHAALFVGEELRRRYAPARAMSVAVSSVRLPPDSPRPPRTFNGPARRMLFVGHLEKVKGIDLILEALGTISGKLAPDWRLDLIGDGPERAALEARAKELGLTRNICFQGRVPWGEELFRFYESADLLLMASLTEGNSRTLLEAMAFALPAVSTSVGEAPRLLSKEALVKPGDVNEFASTVLRIANSPALLQQLSGNNATQIAQYTPEQLRQRRASFIDRMIGVEQPRIREIA